MGLMLGTKEARKLRLKAGARAVSDICDLDGLPAPQLDDFVDEGMNTLSQTFILSCVMRKLLLPY